MLQKYSITYLYLFLILNIKFLDDLNILMHFDSIESQRNPLQQLFPFPFPLKYNDKSLHGVRVFVHNPETKYVPCTKTIHF